MLLSDVLRYQRARAAQGERLSADAGQHAVVAEQVGCGQIGTVVNARPGEVKHHRQDVAPEHARRAIAIVAQVGAAPKDRTHQHRNVVAGVGREEIGRAIAEGDVIASQQAVDGQVGQRCCGGGVVDLVLDRSAKRQ